MVKANNLSSPTISSPSIDLHLQPPSHAPSLPLPPLPPPPPPSPLSPYIIIIIIIHIYIAHYSHCALMRFFKNTVIPLLNTHRSYTEKIKVFKSFLNIVMESALWIFRGSSFHNLAADVPKRRFPK